MGVIKACDKGYSNCKGYLNETWWVVAGLEVLIKLIGLDKNSLIHKDPNQLHVKKRCIPA